MKNYSLFLSRVLLLAGSVAFPHIWHTFAQAECLDDIRKAGVLTAGNALLGARPSLWQEQDGTYRGIDADLLQEITKRLGIPRWQFIITEWTTLIPGLKVGRWDIVLSDQTITEERMFYGHITYSHPYFLLYDRIIVLGNSPFHTVADLKNATLGSVLGTTDSLMAHSLVDKGLAAKVSDFNTFGDPFVALRNGQIDAIVVDQATLKAQKEHFVDLRTLGPPIFYDAKPAWKEAQAKASYKLGSEGIVVRANCPRLLHEINRAMDSMKQDGTIRTILKRYNVWEELEDNLTQNEQAE
ncbi:amino acid ABC transporter substrate-binding protein [Acetobacter syzygii]|uniref:substrate-binding periplasmic protein n=1 Tax=Acetobacter syzygii TaxID=146476 RepID=UPI0005E7C452|nr:ABC transporter substrate-binding protein [Acetobacter syzygii]GAN70153.1 ABC transporter glutamine permease [Acetobacter syzygii]GBR66320.1 amino acid ABC transporter ATP-binding protein [Acetobacter syzygii NRIC 0483]GEL57111.1 amino acid ABC transporter substrate-binding protein [Acetobacter syzygii]